RLSHADARWRDVVLFGCALALGHGSVAVSLSDAARDRRQARRERPSELSHSRDAGGAQLERGLVHVQTPRNLELNGVYIVGWLTIMTGRKAAPVRVVVADRPASSATELVDQLDDWLGGGRATPRPRHEIGAHAGGVRMAAAALARHGVRTHE